MQRRALRRALAAGLVATGLLAGPGATVATAGRAAATAPIAVRNQAVKIPLFTHPLPFHPRTGPSELTLQLVTLLQQVQPRASVRIAMFQISGSPLHLPGVSNDVSRLLRAVIEARRDRHADVRLVVDASTMHAKAIHRLQRRGIAVDACSGGCYSRGGGAVMHDKFMTISGVHVEGESGFRPVVVQMTSNWTNPQLSQRYWNSAIEFAGDSALYADYRQYWQQLDRCARGRPCPATPDPGSFTTASHVSGTFFPQRRRDPVLAELAAIRCPSVVDVAVNVWHRDSRGRAILHRLGTLRRDGCEVRTVTPYRTGIVKRLASTLHHQAHCTDASGHTPHNAFSDVPSVHSKYVVVGGRYAGSTGATMVFTGSETFGNDALARNDNTWLTVSDNRHATDAGDDSVYDAYAADFSAMWSDALPCAFAPH